LRGTPAPGVPLFLCPICGWTTTASLAQAVRAHELGVTDCEGVLEPVAYAGTRFTGQVAVGERDRGHAPSRTGPTKAPDP
jgi:hypothetical protein